MANQGYARSLQANSPYTKTDIPGTLKTKKGTYKPDVVGAVGQGIGKSAQDIAKGATDYARGSGIIAKSLAHRINILIENPFNVPKDSEGNYQTISTAPHGGSGKLNPKYKGK